MLAARGYATKKQLASSIGKPFRYTETSLFGAEFKAPGFLTVVGPSPTIRKWYANVWVDANGLITRVR